jgi:hypothetical protein
MESKMCVDMLLEQLTLKNQQEIELQFDHTEKVGDEPMGKALWKFRTNAMEIKQYQDINAALNEESRKLREKIRKLESDGDMQILREDAERGTLQKRTIYQWSHAGTVETLSPAEVAELRQSAQVITNERAEDDILYRLSPDSGYNVTHVFFTMPDKRRVLHFNFVESLNIWGPRTVQVKASSTYLHQDRKTVRSVWQLSYDAKPDLVLNSKWHVISDTEPVQTCILLRKREVRSPW